MMEYFYRYKNCQFWPKFNKKPKNAKRSTKIRGTSLRLTLLLKKTKGGHLRISFFETISIHSNSSLKDESDFYRMIVKFEPDVKTFWIISQPLIITQDRFKFLWCRWRSISPIQIADFIVGHFRSMYMTLKSKIPKI